MLISVSSLNGPFISPPVIVEIPWFRAFPILPTPFWPYLLNVFEVALNFEANPVCPPAIAAFAPTPARAPAPIAPTPVAIKPTFATVLPTFLAIPSPEALASSAPIMFAIIPVRSFNINNPVNVTKIWTKLLAPLKSNPASNPPLTPVNGWNNFIFSTIGKTKNNKFKATIVPYADRICLTKAVLHCLNALPPSSGIKATIGGDIINNITPLNKRIIIPKVTEIIVYAAIIPAPMYKI